MAIELPEGVETWDAELRGESLELVQSDTGQWMQVKDVPLIQAQVLAGVRERLESDAMFLAILDVIDDGGATRERAQIRTRKIRDVILATLNPPVPASEVVGILKGHRSVYDQEGKG